MSFYRLVRGKNDCIDVLQTVGFFFFPEELQVTSVFLISEKKRIYFVERNPAFLFCEVLLLRQTFPLFIVCQVMALVYIKKKYFKLSNIFPE